MLAGSKFYRIAVYRLCNISEGSCLRQAGLSADRQASHPKIYKDYGQEGYYIDKVLEFFFRQKDL